MLYLLVHFLRASLPLLEARIACAGVQQCIHPAVLSFPELTTFSSTRMQPGQIPSWMELTFPPDLLGSFLSIAYSQTAG